MALLACASLAFVAFHAPLPSMAPAAAHASAATRPLLAFPRMQADFPTLEEEVRARHARLSLTLQRVR